MIFQITAFVFAAIFFSFLTWVTKEPIIPSWTWYLSVILPLIFLSALAATRLTGRVLAAYLPGVVVFSVCLLLSLIDLKYQQKMFILVGSGIYYFSLLALYRLHHAAQDQTARAMQNLAALGSLLFVYAAAYGLYLNFEVPLWLLMLVFFLSSFIVSYQTLRGISFRPRRYVLLMSLILGSIFGELVWILHFWPFGYLTTGMITLLLFYWMWKVALDALRGNFRERIFLFETLALGGLIVLLLFSTPWRIMV